MEGLRSLGDSPRALAGSVIFAVNKLFAALHYSLYLRPYSMRLFTTLRGSVPLRASVIPRKYRYAGLRKRR